MKIREFNYYYTNWEESTNYPQEMRGGKIDIGKYI